MKVRLYTDICHTDKKGHKHHKYYCNFRRISKEHYYNGVKKPVIYRYSK